MWIAPDEISDDESVAVRVLAHARTIAPRLHDLDGNDRYEAIAILSGIAEEVAGRGSRDVESEGVGSARVKWRAVSSAFWPDDRATLIRLAGPLAVAGPEGSFPRPSREISRLWPEGC